MDLKKEAARAGLEYIKNGASIGMGAGSTMGHLVEFLRESVQSDKKLTLYTSSFSTAELMRSAGLTIADTRTASHVDVYFDGCDQVDHQLNALKSGGGIHTREKLLASMATECIILADEVKYVTVLDVKYPLVLEVLPDAIAYVEMKIKKQYSGVLCKQRLADKYDGPVFTTAGNLLLDCFFLHWPPLNELQQISKSITGVVDHSLFFNIITRAVIAGKDGIMTYERKK